MRCFCCSSLSFAQCCKPFIDGIKAPDSAEQLMRSRFSAYAVHNYEYVLNTYSNDKQQGLSAQQLKDSADGANWFALTIHRPSKEQQNDNTVEFTAFYFENKNVFQLHETSRFIKENGLWRYHDGTLHDDCGKVKYGRNLPCLCASNKKFKQCCALKAR